MKTLHIEPTSTAQWHSLVHEAQGSCDRPLTEPLESYLVFLLMRFSRRSDVAARAMALAYLEAAQLGGHDASLRLRDVGDQCLLVSGLFPQRARRRRVRVSYFVDLGRRAYRDAAGGLRHGAAELYQELAQNFVALMDVLQAMRGVDGPVLDPLLAAELCADTNPRLARLELARSLVKPGVLVPESLTRH